MTTCLVNVITDRLFDKCSMVILIETGVEWRFDGDNTSALRADELVEESRVFGRIPVPSLERLRCLSLLRSLLVLSKVH